MRIDKETIERVYPNLYQIYCDARTKPLDEVTFWKTVEVLINQNGTVAQHLLKELEG